MTSPGLQLVLAEVTTRDWVGAAGITVVGLLAAFSMRPLIRVVARPLRLQDYAIALISRLLSVAVIAMTLVYALRQLEVAVGPLIGALGVTGIVIALALQPVMGNLVAAIMIHARRPIRPGDQIESNGHRGTIIEVNTRAVVMMSFDGEVVYLPNLTVLETALVNQTREEIRRTALPFQVGYEADLRRTQEVVGGAIRDVSALGPDPLCDVLVTGFGESGVDMVARFWHPSEELSAWHAISEVAITIRETLRREGITIPFPQRVLHVETAPAPIDHGQREPTDLAPS